MSIYDRLTKAEAQKIHDAWVKAGRPQRKDERGWLPPPLDPKISPDENWKRLK